MNLLYPVIVSKNRGYIHWMSISGFTSFLSSDITDGQWIINVWELNYFSPINNVFGRQGKCADGIFSRDDSGGGDRGERRT